MLISLEEKISKEKTQMKKRQKQSSMVVTLVLLLNIFTQFAVPMVAYATTVTPTVTPPNEDITLSIPEILDLEDEENEVTVEGYIVGSVQDEDVLRENFVDDSNIALADNPDELDSENMLFVELPEAFADEFGLNFNPELLDAQVTLTGFTGEYLGHNGLVDITDLTLVPDEVEEPEVDEEVEDVEETEEDFEEEATEEPVEALVEEDSEEVVEEAVEETSADTEAEIETFATTFQEEEDFFELPIMHMNDTHARVDSYPSMVTAVNSFRNENPEALLFHAGDVFSGTLYFNEFEGAADLALLNLMGIDAFTFGNHEFDLGASENGHASLAAFVGDAEFPFLGTNIDFSNDPNMAPYETNTSLEADPNNGEIYDSLIFEVEGEQVGVFGLTTEDTENIASPMSISFSNYVDAATDAVAEFENAGIDKIIAVTHIGHDSAPAYGNDIVLANQVAGIDVIVGGHSHTALNEPYVVNEDASDPTVIVQAGQYSEYLGTLHVTFNENGEIVEHSGELLDVDGYDPDPEAVTVLDPYREQIEAINNEEIGAIALKDLTNPRHGDGDEISVRANETELGNLVTDAMLAKTQELYPETVIAFQNGGGIRAPIAEGPITVGEVIEVLPFGNNPVVVELSGQEIKDTFEISVGADERPEGGLGENGGFLHVSGMEFYYDSTREKEDRIVAMFVEQDGQLNRIQLDENYLVTTNAFTAGGGDGLTPLKDAYEEGRVQDSGAIDWEQLRDYMVEEQYLDGVVDPVIEGRIIDLLGQDYVDYRIAQLQDRIAELEEALRNLETENASLVEEINTLQKLLASLRADLEAGNAELAELEQRIAELEARLKELEDTPGEDDSNGKEEPDEDESNGENGQNGGNDNGGENGEGSQKGKGGQEGKDGRKDPKDSEDSKESKEKDEEKSLPTTGAAPMLITFIGGTTLIVSGLGVETWRRRKSRK